MKRAIASFVVVAAIVGSATVASARGGNGYPDYPYGGGQSHSYIYPAYGW